MRRLAALSASLIVLGVLAGTASAGRDAPGDGTLVVKDGTGTVTLAVRGAVIGTVDSGTIQVVDRTPGDGLGPEVTGAERRKVGDNGFSSFGGTGLKLRAVSPANSAYWIRITGTGINLSVVGFGKVITLVGNADTPGGDGKYSLNGNPFHSLPDLADSFALSADSTG